MLKMIVFDNTFGQKFFNSYMLLNDCDSRTHVRRMNSIFSQTVWKQYGNTVGGTIIYNIPFVRLLPDFVSHFQVISDAKLIFLQQQQFKRNIYIVTHVSCDAFGSIG